MGRRFQQIRLALFIRSYCGGRLLKKITVDLQKDPSLARTELSLLAGAVNLGKNYLEDAIGMGERFQRFLNPKYFLFSRDKVEIPTFLAVEREIINISTKGFIEDLLEVDDYQKATLKSAVERVAGNELFQIDDDHEFETKLLELGKSYLRCYYRVARRYKLPTIRILPFLLRLITPF